MSPLPVLLAVLLALVGGFLGGVAYEAGVKDTEWRGRIDAQRAAAESAARAKEHQWQGVADDIAQTHQARQRAIRARLDAALDELRRRPERAAAVSDAPRPACAGGTGAELSRPDAEFLEREAARADILRDAAAGCNRLIDALQPAPPGATP